MTYVELTVEDFRLIGLLSKVATEAQCGALNKALVQIDQQAKRIAELEAAVGRVTEIVNYEQGRSGWVYWQALAMALSEKDRERDEARRLSLCPSRDSERDL